jgi:hypothetical protein
MLAGGCRIAHPGLTDADIADYLHPLVLVLAGLI